MNGIGLKNLGEALARYIEIGVESGEATGGTNTTLEDTDKNWETDRWVGGDIHIYKNGVEYVRAISANTVDTITFAALPTGITVAAGDRYSIRRSDLAKIDEISLIVPHASTTTPLGAGASWTSPTDSSLTTGRLIGSVFADQAGTLYIEQSPDNVNWDIVDSYAISANAGIGFSVEKVAEHIRVRYVNGGVAQTVFRLFIYRRLRAL